MSRFDGQVVVVTGSASGIGRASVRAFAEEGAHIIAVDIDRAANEQHRDELREAGYEIEVVTSDLQDLEGVERLAADLVNRHPRIDVLFNNAGVFVPAGLEAGDLEHWRRIMAVNLDSSYALIRGLLSSLERSTGAAVVNNSSVDGIFGHPAAPAYSIAKGALLTMARALAHGLGRRGIRINNVAPGGIKTRMSDQIDTRISDEVVRLTPLQRLGTPEEVAELVLFLASPAASFISGETITIDGGRNSLTVGSLGPVP